MQRDAGSVRLSAKGVELLTHARGVLRATETLIDAAARPGLVEGLLKLGVTEIVVNTWLREFLKCMKARFPNLFIELTVDLSANLNDALFSRGLDLALQNGPFERATTAVSYTHLTLPTIYSV